MKYAVMILLLSAGFSTAADDEASKKLLKDLEGTYKVTAVEYWGEVVPLQMSGRVTIKADKFTLEFDGGGKSTTRVYTIALDSTTKPIHINLKAEDGPKKVETSFGIISVEGDTSKICYNKAFNQKRPTKFKTSKDDEYMLMTLVKTKE